MYTFVAISQTNYGLCDESRWSMMTGSNKEMGGQGRGVTYRRFSFNYKTTCSGEGIYRAW
jgi:hypothetical protein